MNVASDSLQSFIGARVVRGPDWKCGDQDGGDGHVGTLRKVVNSEEVIVVWDRGAAAKYRCHIAHDLRVLDSGPAGVKHESIVCDNCNEDPIFGTRWKCMECDNYDLCSACYHGGTHSLHHTFSCIDLHKRTRKIVSPRWSCNKISAFGLFPGARVARGLDWQWGAQDRKLFRVSGKVKEIENWSDSTPRSAASVVWGFGKKYNYRVGHEGKVDITATSVAEGYSFYRDHLPVLGTAVSSTDLAVGNHVSIGLDLETVKLLQEGHGGWDSDMEETLTNPGKIVKFDDDDDVSVLYPSGKRWTFNPAVLTVHEVHSAETQSFEVDDVVRILDDFRKVQELQRGHGGWSDGMKPMLGKLGKVQKVLDSKDLLVGVDGQLALFNPACVSKVDSSVEELLVESLSDLLMKLIESDTSANPEQELVKAAAENNVQKIQTLLSNGSVQINDAFNGITALLSASFHGSVDAIKFLIQRGADVELTDQNGDRAIHNAAYQGGIEILKLLAQAGADLNTGNEKKLSPLHVAVNNEQIKSVKCLLELGASPSLQDVYGDTPLHDAITKGRDDIVQLLLEFKAEISVKNFRGFNCLHHAALKGSEGAIEALLATNMHHWTINEKKDDGFTALHIAAYNNHAKVARLLIKQGKADINVQTNKFQTPLHLAIEEQYIEVVQLLVEEGASLDIRDEDGDSPMHDAVRYHTLLQLKSLQNATNAAVALAGFIIPDSKRLGSAAIACLLAEYGADIALKNNADQTPLDLCLDEALSKAINEKHLHRKSPKAAAASDGDEAVGATKSVVDLKTVEDDTTTQAPEAVCIICSERPRDTYFKPCFHIVACSQCAPSVKDCLICNERVESTIQIENCCNCSKKKSNVQFKPCNHICACVGCARMMRKCAQCQTPIVKTIDHADLCGFNYLRQLNSTSNFTNANNAASDEVNQLTRELSAMKEQLLCPICMDNNRNMAFLCGHGTCKDCGERLHECPMCRTRIERRVLLF